MLQRGHYCRENTDITNSIEIGSCNDNDNVRKIGSFPTQFSTVSIKFGTTTMFSFTVISFAILLNRAAASQQLHLVGYEPLIMNVADHVSYRV